MRPREAGVVAGFRTYRRVCDTPPKLIACMEIAAAGQIAQGRSFTSAPEPDALLLATFASVAAVQPPDVHWDPDIRQFVGAGKALDDHQCGLWPVLRVGSASGAMPRIRSLADCGRPSRRWAPS
jgi:hypothetical protein